MFDRYLVVGGRDFNQDSLGNPNYSTLKFTTVKRVIASLRKKPFRLTVQEFTLLIKPPS